MSKKEKLVESEIEERKKEFKDEAPSLEQILKSRNLLQIWKLLLETNEIILNIKYGAKDILYLKLSWQELDDSSKVFYSNIIEKLLMSNKEIELFEFWVQDAKLYINTERKKEK